MGVCSNDELKMWGKKSKLWRHRQDLLTIIPDRQIDLLTFFNYSFFLPQLCDYWHKEVVESLCLEVFKKSVDVALRAVG